VSSLHTVISWKWTGWENSHVVPWMSFAFGCRLWKGVWYSS